ncbi:macro domain-containing protein [Cryptosporangium japonicum]|uniref:Macro domain-containing protein n=1 Tax=Cryptosporangium japonicum TaxID=80872 RepID=A0ABP3EK18_9ACTN
MLVDVEGDLLETRADALVNAVNTVGVMGKGIALDFKRAFPSNFRAYADSRYVVNFPTKAHWRSKSTLADVEAGLRDLRRVVLELGVQSVAVPALGCGNGGLPWSRVRPLIDEALGDLPGVEVLLFAPGK